MDMIAVCPKCGEAKPVDEFYADKGRPSGRAYACKVCHIAAATSRYHRKNPDAQYSGPKRVRVPKPHREPTPLERVCIGCSTTFAVKDPRQMHCTSECRRTVRGTCADCGIEFTKKRGSETEYTRCRACAQVVSHRKRIAMLTERGDIGGPRQPTLTLTIACEQCGADIVTYDKARRWCSAECKYDAQVIRVGRPIERGERHCIDCDADISHVWARRRCRDCDVKRMKDQARASGDKGRARYYGVPYEYVSRRKVYDRDGWQCGICSELIDRTLAYPDPRSASLDHVIPISLGGPHTAANCQAAHLSCNVGKSNRVGDELDVESAGRA